MSAARKLINLGLITVSALAAPALAGGTPASASTANMSVGSTIRGIQAGDGTHFGTLTTCTESFRGRVTHDGDVGDGFTVGIDEFSFTQCDSGTRVTLNTRPDTLVVNSIALWAIRPMDVNITTPRGTCRYVGGLGDSTGFFSGTQLRGTGLLYQRSDGCDGPRSIQVTQAETLVDENGDPPRM
jgi:hypothetical protein